MGFLEFLKGSPTCFHAVNNLSKLLDKNGFTKLDEAAIWGLKKGGKYYFTRNNSTLLSFIIPNNLDNYKFNIAAAHTDSPTFKLKPNFNYVKANYSMLNTEVYGGPIFPSWMDRALNIAGRVFVKNGNMIESKLISFDKAMAIIPNSPIHYMHELNTGHNYNAQNELIPLLSLDKDLKLMPLIAEKLGVKEEDIIGHDLFLANLDRGIIGGLNNELIMAPQIDNLECSFAILNTFSKADINSDVINVAVVFNNEEIGSSTREGATGSLLSSTLKRISSNLGKTEEEYQVALASSFIISADNAQGFHPNYAQNYDPTNAPVLGGGVVIKSAARGSYSTDGFSLAYFTEVCKKAGAKYQMNTNKSDIRGGSTLGAISVTNVSIPSVDIGLAQLAMHSAYETANVSDYYELEKVFTEFYKSDRLMLSDSNYKL